MNDLETLLPDLFFHPCERHLVDLFRIGIILGPIDNYEAAAWPKGLLHVNQHCVRGVRRQKEQSQPEKRAGGRAGS